MDDSGIVDLFIARDESALNELALKYGARLLRIAYGIVGDHHTAEEVVNDAYLSAWELIPPNEPREYLFAFMASIVRHKAIDRCRERNAGKRKAELSELTREMEECIPAKGGVEQEAEANELRRAINGFLMSIPKRNRDIFLRRYWFLDSIEDIAKRFRISRESVKTALCRMRGKLKEYLESEELI